MRVQMAIEAQKRKLEAERKESIDRLRQIERRLSKTEKTSKLWDSAGRSSS